MEVFYFWNNSEKSSTDSITFFFFFKFNLIFVDNFCVLCFEKIIRILSR